MKILIISANREKFPDPVFPLGASYIVSAVKNAGYNVDIFDACFSEDPLLELKNKILEYKPDVVGISIRNVDNNAFPIAECYLPYYQDMIKVIRENINTIIVLGGSGFSIFPELYVNELKVDYGIKGEGEFAFIELLKNIENKTYPEKKIIYSEKIKDINFNSFPTREGFDIDKYYKYSGNINIQTKRGCEFNCNYCTYPVLEGNYYRLRTKEKVVDEIEYWLNTKNMTHIFFVDNIFNYPQNYAKDICKEIIRRNLKIKWSGFFVPKFVDEELVDLCKESGITSMDFGTDAFSENTLKGFNKSFTVDDIFLSCEICKKKGIKFNHSLIFGGPNETMETLNETISNVDKTDPTSVIGFIGVRLYAGTPILNKIKNIEIGINPVFYVSEDVQENLVDFLKEKTKYKKNWIIPGLSKGTDPGLISRLRERGMKGPLWEGMSELRR